MTGSREPKMGEPGWAEQQVREVAQAQADARAQARRMAEEAARAKEPKGTFTVPTYEPDPHQIKTQLALFPAADADPANPLATSVPAPPEGKKRAGRPPGAINVATKEWQEFLLANFTSPLIGAARVQMMTPMELATALGCSLLEAYDRIHKAREFVARYMHQELPKAINVEGANLVNVLVTASDAAAGGIEVEAIGQVTVIEHEQPGDGARDVTPREGEKGEENQ